MPVDSEFRMRAGALRDLITADLAAGLRPCMVTATLGTTSTTSVDPVPAIADLCEEYKLWLHIDAAYAGSAALAPEFRWAFAGVDRADSLVMNPHKWLNVPMDCSVFYTARPEILRRRLLPGARVPDVRRRPARREPDGLRRSRSGVASAP